MWFGDIITNFPARLMTKFNEIEHVISTRQQECYYHVGVCMGVCFSVLFSLPKVNITFMDVFLDCIVLVRSMRLVSLIPTCYITKTKQFFYRRWL